MSLEAQIAAAINGFFPAPGGKSRVYPVSFPQSPETPSSPACRYTFVTTEAIEDVCGTDDETANTRTQIDIIDKTFAGARALRLQVIGAMSALPTPTRLVGGFDDYDSDLKLFRCTVDFISYPSS